MAGLRGAAALVAACMGCFCVTAAAQTPQPAGMVVDAREQAARDSDRVRILQSELTREQAAAAEAAKRRAAHLATSDSKAAEQDQQAQQRATENVAALQRELDAAMRSSNVASAPPARVSVKPAAKPTTSGANAPWWDVYAKPRGAAAAGTSPLTLRATSAAPEATVSNR